MIEYSLMIQFWVLHIYNLPTGHELSLVCALIELQNDASWKGFIRIIESESFSPLCSERLLLKCMNHLG